MAPHQRRSPKRAAAKNNRHPTQSTASPVTSRSRSGKITNVSTIPTPVRRSNVLTRMGVHALSLDGTPRSMHTASTVKTAKKVIA